MGKQRKKRNKPYSAARQDTPTVHRYVAEQEQTKAGRKKLLVRAVIGLVAALLVLLVVVILV